LDTTLRIVIIVSQCQVKRRLASEVLDKGNFDDVIVLVLLGLRVANNEFHELDFIYAAVQKGVATGQNHEQGLQSSSTKQVIDVS
jgi:hypothetical protein